MTYCQYEQKEFPDDEFETIDGVVWHKTSPRHTSAGETDEDGESGSLGGIGGLDPSDRG